MEGCQGKSKCIGQDGVTVPRESQQKKSAPFETTIPHYGVGRFKKLFDRTQQSQFFIFKV